MCGVLYAGHARDAELAADDHGMAHGGADLDDDRACGNEEWCPRGVGDGSHQEVAGLEALLHAAGNPLLSILTPPVFKALSLRYMQDDPPELYRLVAEEHRAITEAVADRYQDAAAEMMSTHLCSLRTAHEAKSTSDG